MTGYNNRRRNVLARVDREYAPTGELLMIHLLLIRDEEHVELSAGDEFMTVDLAYDPWEVTP